MTAKRQDKNEAKPEKPLVSQYSEIGSAALRAALLCLKNAQAAAKPSAKKKAA
jgi:hypothetical protein